MPPNFTEIPTLVLSCFPTRVCYSWQHKKRMTISTSNIGGKFTKPTDDVEMVGHATTSTSLPTFSDLAIFLYSLGSSFLSTWVHLHCLL